MLMLIPWHRVSGNLLKAELHLSLFLDVTSSFIRDLVGILHKTAANLQAAAEESVIVPTAL